jgi:hypothetical protein
MGFFERLKLTYRPPRLNDPDFGPLLFIYISNSPEKSYWEAEWKFPPVGYEVAIGLPGDKTGPTPQGRTFYLSRAAEFDRIMHLVRPQLNSVCIEWLGRPLADDMWADVKLAGFGVEDLTASPISWDVAFETVGKQWLGITIPIVGDSVQKAVVDT